MNLIYEHEMDRSTSVIRTLKLSQDMVDKVHKIESFDRSLPCFIFLINVVNNFFFALIKKGFPVHSINILIFWKSLANILITIMTSFDDRENFSPGLSRSHIPGSLSCTELRPEFSFKSFKVNLLGIFLDNLFSLDEFSLSLL